MIPRMARRPTEFKIARTRTRVQEFLKSGYRAVIGTASRVLPNSVLFYGTVLVRRVGLALKSASAPASFQRVADFLFYNLRHIRPGLVEARSRGNRFFIRLNDPCQYDLLLGQHEPEVLEWILSELKAGMTFLDIGANVGYYSLIGATCVGSAGRVVALEPDAAIAAILRRNVEVNSFRNVEVVQGAACGVCGIVKFGRAVSTSYASGLSCENAVDWIEVPGYSLDSLIVELHIPQVDVVKLDVEGAEIETIEGMKRILAEVRPKLMMELHSHIREADSHPAVVELKKAGYYVRHISGNHVVAEPISSRSREANSRAVQLS